MESKRNAIRVHAHIANLQFMPVRSETHAIMIAFNQKWQGKTMLIAHRLKPLGHECVNRPVVLTLTYWQITCRSLCSNSAETCRHVFDSDLLLAQGHIGKLRLQIAL